MYKTKKLKVNQNNIKEMTYKMTSIFPLGGNVYLSFSVAASLEFLLLLLLLEFFRQQSLTVHLRVSSVAQYGPVWCINQCCPGFSKTTFSGSERSTFFFSACFLHFLLVCPVQRVR